MLSWTELSLPPEIWSCMSTQCVPPVCSCLSGCWMSGWTITDCVSVDTPTSFLEFSSLGPEFGASPSTPSPLVRPTSCCRVVLVANYTASVHQYNRININWQAGRCNLVPISKGFLSSSLMSDVSIPTREPSGLDKRLTRTSSIGQ